MANQQSASSKQQAAICDKNTNPSLLLWLIGLLLVAAVVAPLSGLAQTPPPPPVTTQPLRERPTPPPSGPEEGELIELEDVQIHGEIAQPNVAITVSRAEPLFRELALERTPAEGMNDLDLSGLKQGIPPVIKIREWKAILNRPRQ